MCSLFKRFSRTPKSAPPACPLWSRRPCLALTAPSRVRLPRHHPPPIRACSPIRHAQQGSPLDRHPPVTHTLDTPFLGNSDQPSGCLPLQVAFLVYPVKTHTLPQLCQPRKHSSQKLHFSDPCKHKHVGLGQSWDLLLPCKAGWERPCKAQTLTPPGLLREFLKHSSALPPSMQLLPSGGCDS